MPDRYLDTPPPASLPDSGLVLLAVYSTSTSAAGETMVEKVAEACGRGGDAAALAVEGSVDLLTPLRDADPEDRCRYVVVYGLTPGQIGSAWTCARYEWVSDGPVEFCFVESPDVIAADLERKKRLWACLARVRA